LDTLTEDVIGKFEGIGEGCFFINDLQEAVVGDDDESIGVFLEALVAVLGGVHTMAAFEGEGLGDDTNGERAAFFGDLRYDRGGSGSGSTTQAGGDENHIGAFEYGVELFGGFFSAFSADLGVAAGAKAAGEFIANANFYGCF